MWQQCKFGVNEYKHNEREDGNLNIQGNASDVATQKVRTIHFYVGTNEFSYKTVYKPLVIMKSENV